MTIVTAIKTLNPTAMVVALLAHFAIGTIWFHPSIVGKYWAELSGIEMVADAKWLPLGFGAHILYTFALAVIINLAKATTVLEGLVLGLLVAFGFIGTMLVNELVFMKIPFKLFLIKFGDEVVSLSVAGVILALWK